MDFVTEQLNNPADQSNSLSCEQSGQAEVRNIKASWDQFANRPTWSVVSSRELSLILNVSLQTINNWKMRGILPEPEPNTGSLSGNRNYYRISKIQAWLEGISEDKAHWRFIHSHIPFDNIETIGQAQFLVKHAGDVFGIEKPNF